MKISTEIGSIAKIVGEREAVRLVADAGFDAFDFSMFEMGRYDRATGGVRQTDHPLRSEGYLAFARELGRIARERISSLRLVFGTRSTYCWNTSALKYLLSKIPGIVFLLCH